MGRAALAASMPVTERLDARLLSAVVWDGAS
jgi:hypothetical protein